MMRAAARALLSGVLAACSGAALLALLYTAAPAIVIDFDRDLPRLVGGVHPFERDYEADLTFAWTTGEMTLRLPGLDRRVEWTLDLRVRGARPDGRNPELTFFADGVHIGTHRAPQDFASSSAAVSI